MTYGPNFNERLYETKKEATTLAIHAKDQETAELLKLVVFLLADQNSILANIANRLEAMEKNNFAHPAGLG